MCFGCKSSLSLFLKAITPLNLKLFEFSSVGATPARPEGVCLSIFLFVHHVWQVVAWDNCSRINLQGPVVYEKHPPLWQSALCSLFTHRSKLFEPNSGCSHIISAQSFPWIGGLWNCRSTVLIVPPSPHDPASLPSSSYSNRALIVQRDAFFILAYEILKTLTQHVLSHADITTMSGQGGAGQRGWSYIFGISCLIYNSINM